MSGGRGRGNLLQLLREASAKITESEVASPIASENVSGVESVVHSAGGESDPKSGNASGPTSAGEKKIGSDNQQISDSGIQPTPPPIRAGMARGKLFENLSSMTSKVCIQIKVNAIRVFFFFFKKISIDIKMYCSRVAFRPVPMKWLEKNCQN